MAFVATRNHAHNTDTNARAVCKCGRVPHTVTKRAPYSCAAYLFVYNLRGGR